MMYGHYYRHFKVINTFRVRIHVSEVVEGDGKYELPWRFFIAIFIFVLGYEISQPIGLLCMVLGVFPIVMWILNHGKEKRL